MQKLLLIFAIMLSSCASGRELFSRYYWVGGGLTGISRTQLEQRVSTLYSDGPLTANEKLWLPLLTRYAKQQGGQVASFSPYPEKGYWLDARGRKGFVVYCAENQTFYGFTFWNFRGMQAAHTPCDLLVESIMVVQPDSTLKRLDWQEAGPALAKFKQSLLPLIRKRAWSPLNTNTE